MALFIGSTKRRWLLAGALMAALCGGGFALLPDAQAAGTVFISEFHYENIAGDVGEFVEVTGPAGTDLTGWTIVAYNGANGLSYSFTALNGVIDNESGGQGAVALFVVLQNGPDGIALVDSTGTLIEFLSYEGEFFATNGPANGVTSTDVLVSEKFDTPIGQSLQLVSGVWTGPALASPGDLNPVPTPSVPVCFNKFVGSDVQSIPGIDFESDPPPWQFNVESQGQSIPIVELQQCEGPGFFITAGAEFMLSETIAAAFAPHVGMVDAECRIKSDGPDQVFPADENGVLTATAPTSNQESISCFIENDTITVCVAKDFGPGARALLDSEQSNPDPVRFSIDDGDARQIGPACAQQFLSVLFFVAPGRNFTINELIADDSPMLPVDIECTQFIRSQEQEVSLGDVDLEAATVDIGTFSDQVGPIDCLFTNDALIVCVTKTLGNNAVASGATPGDFTFDLTPAGEAPQQLIPNPEDPLCGGQRLRVAINSSATVGTALPPGTTFSLGEQDPGPQFGLDYAYCDAGNTSFELTEGTSTIEVPALEGISRIDCYFQNESVRVCVAKQVGQTASQGGFTDTGTFTATVDGVPATEQPMTPQPPADENPCDATTDDYFVFYVAPGTAIRLTEALPSSSPLGLITAICVEFAEGDQPLQSRLDGQTVAFDVSNLNVKCTLINEIGVVCVTKTVLAGAEIAGYTADEFGFDVTFNGESSPQVSDGCATSDTTSQEVTGFAYRPGSDVTVQEVDNSTNPLPNGLESAQCETDENVYVNDPGSDLVTFTDVNGRASCEFRNDTLILCVNKRVGEYTLAAGFTASRFGFTVVDDGETIEKADTIDCDGEDSDRFSSVAYALKPDDQGTVTVTENSIGADSQVGLVDATCYPGLNVSRTDLATKTVTSPKQHGGNGILLCEFLNLSIEVTIEKTLITDDGATASVGAFLFDAFDRDGAAISSGMVAGAKFYVAPDTTFTVSERPAVGFTSSATCSDVQRTSGQALSASASVTYTPRGSARQVLCTFVNDDIAPIPICALLIFEEGSTGFTLDDFNLELFKDGALIGQRSAGDPFDAACENTTENTAELLPGSLVQLGKVFADGSSFAFAVSIEDPDELLVFEPLSCSVDAPAATQALAGPDPVTFTVDPGVSRVSCVARANEKPLIVGSGGGLPGGRPPYVEPVVAAAAAAPAPEAAQVVAVAVAAPIAVTGSSTTGVTLPVAFGLLSAGFVGLGLDRRRNANQLG